MKNNTPRTQDAINKFADNPCNLQPFFDFARVLERELNQKSDRLEAEVAILRAAMGEIIELESDLNIRSFGLGDIARKALASEQSEIVPPPGFRWLLPTELLVSGDWCLNTDGAFRPIIRPDGDEVNASYQYIRAK